MLWFALWGLGFSDADSYNMWFMLTQFHLHTCPQQAWGPCSESELLSRSHGFFFWLVMDPQGRPLPPVSGGIYAKPNHVWMAPSQTRGRGVALFDVTDVSMLSCENTIWKGQILSWNTTETKENRFAKKKKKDNRLKCLKTEYELQVNFLFILQFRQVTTSDSLSVYDLNARYVASILECIRWNLAPVWHCFQP